MKNAKRMKVSRRISSTIAETTTDIEMSIHSDSDIIDIPDNDSDIRILRMEIRVDKEE